MAEINHAFDILNDPARRAEYDRQRVGDRTGTGDDRTSGSARRGQPAGVADAIRAKSFQLVNDDGLIRAELSLDRDGDPALHMNDRNGSPRFAIYQWGDEV